MTVIITMTTAVILEFEDEEQNEEEKDEEKENRKT
jgi:hypothetical protein